MHGTGRLDVEREARLPGPLRRLDALAAAVARNLELRHRRALRRRERNFEIPARHGRIDAVARWVGTIRQRGHLQQRLPRDRSIGVVEQTMHGGGKRRVGRERRRRDRLRRRQRAAERRRRRVGARRCPCSLRPFGEVMIAAGIAGALRHLLLGLLQQGQRGARRHRRAWPAQSSTRPAPATSLAGSPAAISESERARLRRSISCDVRHHRLRRRERWRQRPSGLAGAPRPSVRDRRASPRPGSRRAALRQRLPQHDQGGLQVGNAAAAGARAGGERGLQEQAGVLERGLDVARRTDFPSRARLLRQHLRDRLLQRRRQIVRRRHRLEIGEQWRQALLLRSPRSRSPPTPRCARAASADRSVSAACRRDRRRRTRRKAR